MRRHALLLLVLLVLPSCSAAPGQECDRASPTTTARRGSCATSFSDGSKRCGTGVGGDDLPRPLAARS